MILNSDNNNSTSFQSDNRQEIIHQHLEPIFWGTSNLLEWDAEQLLLSIDREKYASDMPGKNNIDDTLKQEKYQEKNEFSKELKDISEQISVKTLLDCRGIYGYFPVITDKETIVVLDPSDYHSEMLSLDITLDEKNKRGLMEHLNPHGDVVALGAVTMGCQIDRFVKQFNETATATKAILLKMCGRLLSLLETKITNEIRRGLGVSDECGKMFQVDSVIKDPVIMHTIFELMGYEERLGIEIDEKGILQPKYSSALFFFHNIR